MAVPNARNPAAGPGTGEPSKAEPVGLVRVFMGGREYLVPPRLVLPYRRGLIDPSS